MSTASSPSAPWPSSEAPQGSAPTAFAPLQGEQFTLLTTFRRSGEGVGTPVWFAQDGETLYITTQQRTGKVKRVRNNPQVTLAPSDRRGATRGQAIPGQARIVASAEEASQADAALRRKYGATYSMIHLIGRLMGRNQAERVFLAIAPADIDTTLA